MPKVLIFLKEVHIVGRSTHIEVQLWMDGFYMKSISSLLYN